MKIDHVGLAVKSLDEMIPFYQNLLGQDQPEIEEIDTQGVRVAIFQTGESRVELLEALNTDSPIARFIEKRGEGMHHLALAVEGIEELISSLKKEGVRFIGDKPVIGAGGKKIIFVHPASTHGVLLELCEAVEEES